MRGRRKMSDKTSVQKLLWFIPRYTRGKVLQVLHGIEQPLYEHFIWSPKMVNDTSMYASKSFDAVMIGESLDEGEHYNQKDIEEYWRIIKQEGHLIVTTNLDEHQLRKELHYLSKLELVEHQPDLMTFVFRKTKNPTPAKTTKKTVCICRLGARGDNMIASSIVKGFKDLDYHVTFMGSPPGIDVLENDPNIDSFYILDVNQVPNVSLSNFWEWQEKQYDKFVNLSETIEMQFLAGKQRTLWRSPPKLRENFMNYNYEQFTHEMAGLEYKPQIKFYSTVEERMFANKEVTGKDKIIVMCIGGSSLHKQIPFQDLLIANILVKYQDAHIYLVGGPEDKESVEKWAKTSRMHVHCGDWSFRQTLAFCMHADLMIGPETGVMVGMSQESIQKMIYLSHSTIENLTRDWKNTTNLYAKNCDCPGRQNQADSCHLLLMNVDGMEMCNEDKETGLARCMFNIKAEESFDIIERILK
jgi:hypothetical protein